MAPTASISTSAPEGSAATSTVDRAGGRSRPLPASSRMAPRFAITCSVCSAIVSPTISLPPGRTASWPETKTRSATRIAWEYGAPWNGAGALSVRMTDLSATVLLSVLGQRLSQGGAERLEDRVEHVLGLLALDQPDVEGEPRLVRELVEEAGDDVGAEAGHSRGGEVDVRDEQRPARGFQHHLGERLVREGVTGTGAPCAFRAERPRDRDPERPAAGHRLGGRATRRRLQLEVQPSRVRDEPEQVVEHRDSGRDRRRARAREADARPRASGPGGGH